MEEPKTVDDIWTEFTQTRSSELRDELITTYASLVKYTVGRLGIPPTSLLDPEDLVSYGMIGLINAIDRFEPARGIRFEAFATPRIRGAVIDQLRALNWLPRSAMTRIRQIEDTLAKLEQRLGRPAQEHEAAAELGISTERYRRMLVEVGISVLSLDAPLGSLANNDEANSLGDLLEDESLEHPDETLEQQEVIDALSGAIDRLPEREQLLLSLYYQEELTMKEISKVMRISESRVCQLHTQALMRLRGTIDTDEPEMEKEEGEQAEEQQQKITEETDKQGTVVSGGRRSRQRVS